MRRLGDNAGMARDDSGDRLLRRLVFMSLLDGIRPSGIPEWVSPVAPVVTQAAVGAGHWAAGRRQRALAAWASAGGVGPWHGSADPGRVAKVHRAAKGPDAQAWHTGAGYRRPDGSIRGPRAIVERPGRPWALDTDGLRRAVRPA